MKTGEFPDGGAFEALNPWFQATEGEEGEKEEGEEGEENKQEANEAGEEEQKAVMSIDVTPKGWTPFEVTTTDGEEGEEEGGEEEQQEEEVVEEEEEQEQEEKAQTCVLNISMSPPLASAAEAGIWVEEPAEQGQGDGASGSMLWPGGQGLTLVHCSAQLKRFVCDGGCV